MSTATSFTCGYLGDIDNRIPTNQLITISATSEKEFGTITGILQKDFSLELNSEWENFMPSIAKELDGAFQAVNALFGKSQSLINPITSRRMWKGTTPLKLKLDFYFSAVNTVDREVIEPCLRLQRLVLPSKGDNFGIGSFSLPLLTPPGPSPLNPEQGDQIKITIGNFLILEQVIIKSVLVTYDNKLDGDGLPVNATVSLEIETYEILTKEKLSKAMKKEYRTPSALVEGNKKATEPIAPVTTATT